MSLNYHKKPLAVIFPWQKELKEGFSDPQSLLDFLAIDATAYLEDAQARRLFPMRVPRHFANLMAKGDWHDPLLQQVIPQRAEFFTHADYTTDPLAEQASAIPGLLHKYHNRVLLIFKGGCAVNCRYCFRRHFPYEEHHNNKISWQKALAYIANKPQINEVILSGGDPLMAKDEDISWLITQLSAITHVQRVRIHTRLPVVIPQRLTKQLLAIFASSRFVVSLVLHINHANELSPELLSGLWPWRQQGLRIFNQAVLLAGINDNLDSQLALHQQCYDNGIQPYYLHLLDKVEGAAHFAVSDADAVLLMQQLQARLSGYMLPTLVREEPHRAHKTRIRI